MERVALSFNRAFEDIAITEIALDSLLLSKAKTELANIIQMAGEVIHKSHPTQSDCVSYFIEGWEHCQHLFVVNHEKNTQVYSTSWLKRSKNNCRSIPH